MATEASKVAQQLMYYLKMSASQYNNTWFHKFTLKKQNETSIFLPFENNHILKKELFWDVKSVCPFTLEDNQELNLKCNWGAI